MRTTRNATSTLFHVARGRVNCVANGLFCCGVLVPPTPFWERSHRPNSCGIQLELTEPMRLSEGSYGTCGVWYLCVFICSYSIFMYFKYFYVHFWTFLCIFLGIFYLYFRHFYVYFLGICTYMSRHFNVQGVPKLMAPSIACSNKKIEREPGSWFICCWIRHTSPHRPSGAPDIPYIGMSSFYAKKQRQADRTLSMSVTLTSPGSSRRPSPGRSLSGFRRATGLGCFPTIHASSKSQGSWPGTTASSWRRCALGLRPVEKWPVTCRPSGRSLTAVGGPFSVRRLIVDVAIPFSTSSM